MKTNTDLFEKTPVPKAVATMAVPTMISMLVVVIYNMADTFFIGQTKDPLQVAAVSLATPVFMIFMALGHLFGIGGSSAISRALGERHKDRACHISSFCCYGSLGLGVRGGYPVCTWNGNHSASHRCQCKYDRFCETGTWRLLQSARRLLCFQLHLRIFCGEKAHRENR